MNVCVHSANFADMDYPSSHVPQEGIAIFEHVFTDLNFPSRHFSMTPRMKARIPKCFGWDLLPGHDVYLWLDGSMQLTQPDSVAWFIEQLGHNDITLFRHSCRKTIKEEADFIQAKLDRHSRYLTARYEGEDIRGQLLEIGKDPTYTDTVLYGSSILCYRPTASMKQALKEWWYHISRFHTVDQLALPYVLRHCNVHVIDQDAKNGSHVRLRRHRRYA